MTSLRPIFTYSFYENKDDLGIDNNEEFIWNPIVPSQIIRSYFSYIITQVPEDLFSLGHQM